jgi:hypothetical protein
MKSLLATLMLLNAALFVFGALQHAGIRVGPFREPVIIPASIVESICALALIWGAVAVLRWSATAVRAALIGNIVAIAGVAIGMVALAVGAGPRTESNDIYHRFMLLLAVVSLAILAAPRGRAALRRN